MKEISGLQRNSLLFGCFGLLFATGYGLSDIEFGGVMLSSSEAWDKGLAQPYVISGLLLAATSIFLHRGETWARWAIVIWCPVTVLGGMWWSLFRGIGTFNTLEFIIEGMPVLTLWVIGTLWILFGPDRRRSSS